MILFVIKRSSLFLLLFYLYGCANDVDPVTWSGSTMGTTYQIKIVHTSLSQKDVSNLKVKIDSVLAKVNHQMSTYDPESEISRFNQFQDTTAFNVSRQFVTVVEKALVVWKDSGYAFDITVGPLVNLWGFGRKGQRFIPPEDNEIQFT